MSRSRKKPYFKEKASKKDLYWRIIRREWKQDLKLNYHKDDFHLRDPKTIIGDWDYYEHTCYMYEGMPSRYNIWTKEEVDKYRRK